MDESQAIFISVHVSTESETDAAKAIDAFSRMILGLALEGLETSLEVSIARVCEGIEYDEER